MLNRRTLRIKVMQTMFALRQSFEANYQIAKENISETFAPDLNSMEFQDRDLLKSQKKEALDCLEKAWVKNLEYTASDQKIKNSVEDQVNFIKKHNLKDVKTLKKQMLSDVEKLKCTFYSFIELIQEIQYHAKNDKKLTHTNFVNNLLINSISLNKQIDSSILDCGKRWEGNPEVRSWFKNLVKNTDEYLEYDAIEKPNFNDHKNCVLFLVKKVLFDSEVIDKYVDELDLYWTENKPMIKSLVLKAIKNTSEDQPFEVPEISYNYDDDISFFGKLYDVTLGLDEKYKNLISKKAQNWDIDRLAVTDRIILEMAIAELIFFPSIPVKVTINEYIELSKQYSTPKSKLFVNGMLDVIANELKEEGVVKKSGRGLMDNK